MKIKETLHKVSEKVYPYSRLMLLVALFATYMVTVAVSQSSIESIVNAQICLIYNIVHTIIFILGLALMILGAALYAAAHIMPGQAKGSLQGYGMGMIIGGVIGVVIAVAAPFILSVITSLPSASITGGCV